VKLMPDRARVGLLTATTFLVASIAAHRALAAELAEPLPPSPEPPPGLTATEVAPAQAAREAVPAVVEAPAAPASAASSVRTPSESIHPLPFEEAPSRWYGWQTLAADGASLALSIGAIGVAGSGSDTPSEALAWGALATYALAAPVVHWVHENPGRGFASLGLRVGGPIVLGLIGVEAEDCSHHGGDLCGLGGALIGVTVGIVAAVTIDAAVFAYDEAPETHAAAARFRVGVGPRGLVAFGSF
jgi:hypothetical protein